jgi:curli biogenesis system outer membrane secretion channel CsgG
MAAKSVNGLGDQSAFFSIHFLKTMKRPYSLRPALLSRTLVLALAASACGTALAEETGSTVEKCSKNLGSIAVSEPQTLNMFSNYGLGSPVSVLRLMIQQSGCFAVLERGVAMKNIQQERALAANGELQGGSNIGKGQLQGADFVMTPNVLFNANTGGIGGAVAGLGRGLFGGALGVLAGGLKFKEAQTSLMIADVRSGIQVAAEEGVAKKTDFSLGGWGYGAGAFASAGGYTSTPEGKMIAASLLDNYNKIVIAIRDKPSLVQTTNVASVVNANASTKAGVPINAGDLVMPRINNVRIFTDASTSSKVIGTVQKGEELISSGEESNGFIKVDSAKLSGWVQKTMVAPVRGA